MRLLPGRIPHAYLLTAAMLLGADQPTVIAHRGGAALRPENTMAAFQHALELGVPVLEFDMNLTADGNIMIHHDSVVNAEVCRPDPGSQVKAGPIPLMTVAELRQFDCGSFQRRNSPYYQPAPGQRMLTLDEFLSAVKASRAVLLGETKMPRPDAAYAVSPERFVDLIHAAIKKHQVQDRFILQTGDYRTVDAMTKKDPGISICLLNSRRFKPAYLDIARRHHATHLMLSGNDATAEQIQELKAAGLKIFSGTANTEADWKKYLDLGMDAILTDDPRGLMEFLSKVDPSSK
jgi:glycerophosphoryl diester phosphodiesterase